MKVSGKNYWFATVPIITMLLCVPTLVTAGGSSAERPEDATPPYGLKIEGEAKGTKLNGAIMIEYYNIEESFQQVPVILGGLNCRDKIIDGMCCGTEGDKTAKARVVLRLRQGSGDKNLYTYFMDVVGTIPLSGDPADIQMAIQNNADLKDAILEDFFGVTDGTMEITLRSISEFGILDEDVTTDLTGVAGSCVWYDIDAESPDTCTLQDCGGSRFLLADIVIAVN